MRLRTCLDCGNEYVSTAALDVHACERAGTHDRMVRMLALAEAAEGERVRAEAAATAPDLDDRDREAQVERHARACLELARLARAETPVEADVFDRVWRGEHHAGFSERDLTDQARDARDLMLRLQVGDVDPVTIVGNYRGARDAAERYLVRRISDLTLALESQGRSDATNRQVVAHTLRQRARSERGA